MNIVLLIVGYSLFCARAVAMEVVDTLMGHEESLGAAYELACRPFCWVIWRAEDGFDAVEFRLWQGAEDVEWGTGLTYQAQVLIDILNGR